MSTLANWSYTQTLTLWRKGAKSPTGQFTYSAPENILCSYRIGGSEQYSDATGLSFTPKSIFWTELNFPPFLASKILIYELKKSSVAVLYNEADCGDHYIFLSIITVKPTQISALH